MQRKHRVIRDARVGKLDLLLLNPQQVKAQPGHKTDRVDAARMAELLQYGLVRGSFVPPLEIRELRDLVRRRVHIQQDRNRVSNRIHRLLECNASRSFLPTLSGCFPAGFSESRPEVRCLVGIAC